MAEAPARNALSVTPVSVTLGPGKTQPASDIQFVPNVSDPTASATEIVRDTPGP